MVRGCGAIGKETSEEGHRSQEGAAAAPYHSAESMAAMRLDREVAEAAKQLHHRQYTFSFKLVLS